MVVDIILKSSRNTYCFNRISFDSKKEEKQKKDIVQKKRIHYGLQYTTDWILT